MKKFLSSLLALTMILSLVIVPANATDQALADGYTLSGSFSVTADKENVASGELVNLTAANITATKTGAETQPTFEYVYTWGSGATATEANATATPITTNPAGETKTYSCTLVITDTTNRVKVLEETKSVRVSVTNAQAAFEATVTKVTLAGRSYDISKSNDGTWSATVYYFGNDEPTEGIEANAGYSTYDSTNKKLTVKKTSSSDETIKHDVSITLKKANPSVEVVLDGVSDSGISLFSGFTYTFKATYENKDNSSNVIAGAVKYNWTVTDSNGSKIYSKDNSTNTFKWTAGSKGSYTLTCSVDEGNSKDVTRANKTLTVEDNPYSPNRSNESSTKTIATNNSTTCEFKAPVLKNKNNADDIITYRSNNTKNFDIAWVVTRGSNLVSVDKRPADGYGIVTAKSGVKSGTATVTATITYMGKEYPALEYTIDISALDAELSSIVNGDSDSYSLTNIKDKLADAIKKQNSSFRYNDINTITVVGTPSRVTLKNGRTTLTNGSSVNDDITIYADEAYIGDASFQLKVNNNYVVTMYLTVDSKGEIKDTVTGTSANKSVTFTNSDYDCLYIYEGSASFKSDMYNGDWSRTSYVSRNWKPVAENKDYTVSSSAFDRNGKATLYVVAVDDKIASTGTITVSQKSYDINYNVVAGKSVSFNQKDFDSFLADYAEDNDDYNPKKDDITFDYATLNSLPDAKREGTLYYGGSEVTSTSNRKAEYTDMDKMTFEAVAKPTKDTVTLTFKVQGYVYKNGSSKKNDLKPYTVSVVINVVKEDITYTVGIDDTVQLTARDFVNFLQDAKTSYRKSTLDYVKFDVSGKNVSSYAYGGLYRSYSSYSTGKLADSTDKFYYEPSRTQYDLADVAYHTTRWAEAGKTIYIPFTVYGTKGEEASGTMAITIAQTMNFIDVKASDFFYEPVKWAVNNKITNGTSSTTFSPYKNCNRAEIVTFLWRAAGSPEPTVTRNPFTDVNSVRDASYYKAILWASQKGITAGSTATTFSPYQECTRSQIVTFLYRYAGKPSGYYSNPFKDVSSVNEASYYNAILWAVGKGITQGTSTTTFSPYASCTRGEAVTFLYRYVNGVK